MKVPTLNTHFYVTMIINGSSTQRWRGLATGETHALRLAVRWAAGRLGTLKLGQEISIRPTEVTPATRKSQTPLRSYRVRQLGMDEALEPADRIRIPAGLKYRTAHPKHSGVIMTAKITYIVAVGVEVSAGSDDVQWSGNGGYLCWAPKDEVERVIE